MIITPADYLIALGAFVVIALIAIWIGSKILP